MENIETLLAAVAQTQGFDDDDPVESTSREMGSRSSDPSPEIRREMGGSHLAGAPVEGFGEGRPPVVVNPPPAAVVAAASPVIGAGEKRRRGRPPKGMLVTKAPPPKRQKQEDEEEDVCFICFDGGSLVLCDRKGCPKAYHPPCIKRDEAFFQSKAKWNCGWHICSVCQKTSHYMCYTCTYSLCKGCTRDADYVVVRGNKGFCSICMKTIMLIEGKDQANNDSVQVDFDDKTSWEYLFKWYWISLKEKLSLSLSELIHAKSPWKGATVVACNLQMSSTLHTVDGGNVSGSFRSSEPLTFKNDEGQDGSNHIKEIDKASSINCQLEALDVSKRQDGPSHAKDIEKLRSDEVTDKPSTAGESGEPIVAIDSDKPSTVGESKELSIVKDEQGLNKTIAKAEIGIEGNGVDSSNNENPHIAIGDAHKPCIFTNMEKETEKVKIAGITEWASKELLEFVAYMKNGDTSTLSQFDVQSLLLDYIKRNNLRDPRRKSQIVCDLRLKNLFAKERVGHIEMLKLLEFHFLIKEDSQKNSFIPAGFVAPSASHMEIDGNDSGMPSNSRKRKTRKRSEERTPPRNNLNEYAAVDVHNMNLIYLRRNLMENLIEDKEKFVDKVIGSIVRIRISSDNQKPDVYRLVQVVGTSKVAEPYKVGDKMAVDMLEVLNLDKKEVVSIDSISNQEFTEDECRRLRQSIRCGLAKLLTVGDIQKKAMELQSVRINDRLEAEVLRLNHLRDRASEKGLKKELREYVDKIQLLKSAEERQRRISEVPEIHADPKMSPYYESEEDLGDVDKNKSDAFSRSKYLDQNGRKPTLPNKKGAGKQEGLKQARDGMIGKVGMATPHSLKKHKNQIDLDNCATGGHNNNKALQRSGLETSNAAASVGHSPSASNIETEKLWHYRDPNSKIQGPFSMIQLRKWSTTGLFPPEMRIWTNHEQYDSLLLTDALNGQFHGASELFNPPSELQDNVTKENCEREGTNTTDTDEKQSEAALCEKTLASSVKDTGLVKSDESGSSWPQCWDLLKDNNPSGDDVQTCPIQPVQGHESNEANHVQQIGENNPSVPIAQNQMSSGTDLQIKSCTVQVGLSSDDNLRCSLIDLSVKNMESAKAGVSADENLKIFPIDLSLENEEHESVSKATVDIDDKLRSLPLDTSLNVLGSESISKTGASSNENLRSLPIDLSLKNVDYESVSVSDSVKQGKGIDISNFPSPTPDLTEKQWLVQSTEKQDCASPDVPVEHICFLELLSPAPRSDNGDHEGHSVETKQSGLTNFLMPNSGPSWSNADGIQIPDEWCGFSPTPGKQSVHEWDLALVSPSSVKPPEATNQIPPNNDQLTHHVANMSSWLEMLNEPIEFDALGEESVSDLLAEVDAMESLGGLPSPTSAMKFAKELIQDCKDDCFSSIEFSHTADTGKSDAFSSTGEIQLASSGPCKPIGTTPVDALDSFRRSGVHSSASSEGETNAPVYTAESGSGSDFHPSAQHNTGQDIIGANVASSSGLDPTDPGWGNVQGNINLVTVQGNVNLVLGGPAQGMTNLGWGSNPGTAWVNPNMNRSPLNVSLPWDGQRKYGGERYTSPREWAYQGGGESGFGRGRLPWGRQPYGGSNGGGGGGGGGYSRSLPKGQRVCKFYESGRCKKGAFCDYLHP